MAAKLVFALIALTIIISVAVIASYWYFDRQAERSHEREQAQLDHTEHMVDIAEREGRDEP